MRILSLSLFLLVSALLISCAGITPWVEYHNTTFGYKIQLPEQPKVETRSISSPMGSVPAEAVTAFEPVSATRGNIFTVSCTSFPAPILDAADTLRLKLNFDEIQERIVNRFEGTLVYEKDVEMAGFPVREFRLEFVNPELEGVTELTVRVLIKENLQFMFQAMAEKGKPNQASIDKFMGSFSFTR